MKTILSFIAGIGIGAVISCAYMKNKYEEQINEEFREAREYKKQQEEKKEAINKKANDVVESEEEIDNSAEEIYEEELEKAKNIINYNGYSKAENCDKAVIKNPLFVITPDEFASEIGYDTDTFYIFEDDVIANDNNEIVNNVKETFGMSVEEIRNQFGIHEDDSVYIRNEKIEMDYEILRELDTYKRRNGE